MSSDNVISKVEEMIDQRITVAIVEQFVAMMIHRGRDRKHVHSAIDIFWKAHPSKSK